MLMTCSHLLVSTPFTFWYKSFSEKWVILVFYDQVQLPGPSGKLDLEGGCRLGWVKQEVLARLDVSTSGHPRYHPHPLLPIGWVHPMCTHAQVGLSIRNWSVCQCVSHQRFGQLLQVSDHLGSCLSTQNK